MKEKLIELLTDVIPHCDNELRYVDDERVERLADHLIANGVTFAKDNNVPSKWIPVTERLPESGKEAVMIALRWGEVDIGWCEDEKWGSEFVNEYEDGEVTHWMPLPEPPKGE